MTNPKPKAIVVLSGGQDSATTLIKAASECEVIGAVHFDYGQKHKIETECAKWWASRYNIPLITLSIPTFGQIGDSNLLADGDDVNQNHAHLPHLPSSFVPGRNLAFLTFAAAVAVKLGATEVWTGVCEADEAGYPDCRIDTMSSLQSTIRKGMDFPEFKLKCPLIRIDKGETWKIAEDAGMQFFVKYLTHTCYNGDHTTLNFYGFGCGNCASCKTREQGYLDWLERYHYASFNANRQIYIDGNTVEKHENEVAPWWTSIDQMNDYLKGINTATEV